MRSRSLIGIVLPIGILGITFLFVSLFAPTVWHAIISDKAKARRFPSYNDCADSIYGNLTIRYPFGKCGPVSAQCFHDQNIQITFYQTIPITSYDKHHFRVIGNITESSYYIRGLTLQIIQDSWSQQSRPDYLYNVFEYDFFTLSEGYIFGILLNCTQQIQHINKSLTWLDWGETERYFYFYNGSLGYHRWCVTNIDFCISCARYGVFIPKDKNYNISIDKNLKQANQKGFQITWTIPDYCTSCNATGGRCYSKNYEDLYCVCHHGVYYMNCSEGHHAIDHVLSLGVAAEIFFGVFALFSIIVASCILVHRQTWCNSTVTVEQQSILELMDHLHSTAPSVENFLNYYSSQVPTRYSYAQIMIYTNNLAEKLGKGGFGTVYKGNLPNGRGIAVKILDESKQSEQQFIAEVATVGTTCHVNLVRLLGYCSQVSIRALVYEYMVNGSLEKYIHGSEEDKLDWKQLYSIALGTAHGIAYLHDECRNRILHFDIKPHNVLLDSNFLPKVADFGLAKITDREESHISVGNRGTLGYAAPEMWSRMYGAVTDRSDVYSYGMLLMEIVGQRKNMDIHNRESTSSKFFYPEWAFKQVEKGEFGNLRKENMSEEEQDIAKNLCLVGLWCIQFNASRRPPMNKVVHMLEGGVEITIPPYPFPVDPPPVQICASDPSSSTYSLEVQMINPTNTHVA